MADNVLATHDGDVLQLGTAHGLQERVQGRVFTAAGVAGYQDAVVNLAVRVLEFEGQTVQQVITLPVTGKQAGEMVQPRGRITGHGRYSGVAPQVPPCFPMPL